MIWTWPTSTRSRRWTRRLSTPSKSWWGCRIWRLNKIENLTEFWTELDRVWSRTFDDETVFIIKGLNVLTSLQTICIFKRCPLKSRGRPCVEVPMLKSWRFNELFVTLQITNNNFLLFWWTQNVSGKLKSLNCNNFVPVCCRTIITLFFFFELSSF